MQRNYWIDIDYHLQLIRCKYIGTVCPEELCKAREEVIQISRVKEGKYYYLTDYRDVDFDFKVECLDKVWSLIDSNKEILQGTREAILINKPRTCAYCMILKIECEKMKLDYKVCLFSTMEAALWWLEFERCID